LLQHCQENPASSRTFKRKGEGVATSPSWRGSNIWVLEVLAKLNPRGLKGGGKSKGGGGAPNVKNTRRKASTDWKLTFDEGLRGETIGRGAKGIRSIKIKSEFPIPRPGTERGSLVQKKLQSITVLRDVDRHPILAKNIQSYQARGHSEKRVRKKTGRGKTTEQNKRTLPQTSSEGRGRKRGREGRGKTTKIFGSMSEGDDTAFCKKPNHKIQEKKA